VTSTGQRFFQDKAKDWGKQKNAGIYTAIHDNLKKARANFKELQQAGSKEQSIALFQRKLFEKNVKTRWKANGI
jgi:peptide methionine sulfoxide reductase MsrA